MIVTVFIIQSDNLPDFAAYRIDVKSLTAEIK